MKRKLNIGLHVYKTRELVSRHVVNKNLSVQRELVFIKRTNHFLTNAESLSPLLAVQNAHSHVLIFNSDINKEKPHLMNNVKPSISCFLANAGSIINRMHELESYVYALKPDLIMITESWSGEDISDAELSIDYFSIFCSDRKIYVGCILYIY